MTRDQRRVISQKKKKKLRRPSQTYDREILYGWLCSSKIKKNKNTHDLRTLYLYFQAMHFMIHHKNELIQLLEYYRNVQKYYIYNMINLLFILVSIFNFLQKLCFQLFFSRNYWNIGLINSFCLNFIFFRVSILEIISEIPRHL